MTAPLREFGKLKKKTKLMEANMYPSSYVNEAFEIARPALADFIVETLSKIRPDWWEFYVFNNYTFNRKIPYTCKNSEAKNHMDIRLNIIILNDNFSNVFQSKMPNIEKNHITEIQGYIKSFWAHSAHNTVMTETIANKIIKFIIKILNAISPETANKVENFTQDIPFIKHGAKKLPKTDVLVRFLIENVVEYNLQNLNNIDNADDKADIKNRLDKTANELNDFKTPEAVIGYYWKCQQDDTNSIKSYHLLKRYELTTFEDKRIEFLQKCNVL
jgi:hypothetical protein